MILRAEAFAKTNLVLRVLGRRADGFHELDTIFQTIDLTDTLEVSDAESEIVLECTDPSVPSDERNLAYQAAAKLRERFSIARGARIRLEKKIPAGGGLGGGSSDAAVALVLLSRLWSLSLDEETLAEIGASLGSDVPFFFVGGTVRGRGRGELIEPLPDGRPLSLILVVPPFSISTASVYSSWRPSIAAIGAKPVNAFGENELASAVLEVCPEMDRYRKVLSRYFSDWQISGSGASLLAVEEDPSSGRFAALEADLPGARILRTRTVPRSEYERRSTMGSGSPEDFRRPAP